LELWKDPSGFDFVELLGSWDFCKFMSFMVFWTEFVEVGRSFIGVGSVSECSRFKEDDARSGSNLSFLA
jgi:hypothetical protein